MVEKKKSNRRKKSSEENLKMEPKDLISCLPNDILFHIITFLPFETAVHTNILSRQWKGLWRKAFLVLDGTIEDAVITILSLLADFTAIHHRPRNELGWGFQFNYGQGRVLLAAIAPNNTLQLDFSTGEQQEFPMSFNWLLPLNLPKRNKWPFPYKQDDEILEMFPPLNLLFKIKSLYLISVSSLSSKALTSMVSNFLDLESLTIEKCNGLECLDIVGAYRLENLAILDCPHLGSFYLEGSCLRSFRYRGRVASFQFSNHSYSRFIRRSVDDAMLAFTQGPLTEWKWKWEFDKADCQRESKGDTCGCQDVYKCFKHILKSLEGVNSLTICRWLFEESICTKFPTSSRDHEFHFNNLNDLWWIDCSMEREQINALLCFLKLCPKLERLYVTIDPNCYNLPSTERFSAVVNAPDKLNGLKLVKIEGCRDEKNEIFFARRLIPLFKRQPVIISKPERNCLRHLIKVLNLEKRGKYPYKFQRVENHHDTHPDHPHMKL